MKDAMKHLLVITANILLLAVTVYSQSVGPARNAATLAEQKMCAEAAKGYFRESHGNGFDSAPDETSISTYTNHFNDRLQKCFIRINLEFKNHKTGASLHSNTVIDVFENLTYGHWIENRHGLINSWVRNAVSRAEEACFTWSEFEARINR
jgi:hypothetical protein